MGQLRVQLHHLGQTTPQREACVAIRRRKYSLNCLVQILVHKTSPEITERLRRSSGRMGICYFDGTISRGLFQLPSLSMHAGLAAPLTFGCRTPFTSDRVRAICGGMT